MREIKETQVKEALAERCKSDGYVWDTEKE